MYIIYNLDSKLVFLQRTLQKSYDSESNTERYVHDLLVNLLTIYTQVLTKLVRIDKNGSFESDDEVGFVFKTLKNTIEDLKERLDILMEEVSSNTGIVNDEENR
jgi:site-specific recombinase